LRDAGELDQFDFYICGPGTFAQDLYDGLRGVGVPNRQIFAEAFGPASLKRHRGPGEAARRQLKPATGPVEVVFSKSGLHAQWTTASGTLLEFAETLGLDPPSSCRAGSCGTCRTHLLAGAVAYSTEPGTEVSDHDALICCARPAFGEGQIVLDL
jgi:ferredoxin